MLIVVNFLERMFWTFVQAFVAYAVLQTTLGVDTAQAAAMAGTAAVLTLILGILTDWAIPTDLPPGVLAMARVFRTFAVSLLTILLSAPELKLDADAWKIALVGALPAVLAIIKVIAAEHLGAATPALLPAKIDVLAVENAGHTLAA